MKTYIKIVIWIVVIYVVVQFLRKGLPGIGKGTKRPIDNTGIGGAIRNYPKQGIAPGALAPKINKIDTKKWEKSFKNYGAPIVNR